MTREERELAIYCLKSYSDIHNEVCEECSQYPKCDHFQQDELFEKIIKELEKEQSILADIKAEIEKKGFNSPLMNPVFTMTEILEIIDKHTGKENEE